MYFLLPLFKLESNVFFHDMLSNWNPSNMKCFPASFLFTSIRLHVSLYYGELDRINVVIELMGSTHFI